MNSGVPDTFVLGNTTAITSCVPDPSQVAGDLSTCLTWRIPECLHIDNLDILNDTYGCKWFPFRTPVSFLKVFPQQKQRHFILQKEVSCLASE